MLKSYLKMFLIGVVFLLFSQIQTQADSSSIGGTSASSQANTNSSSSTSTTSASSTSSQNTAQSSSTSNAGQSDSSQTSDKQTKSAAVTSKAATASAATSATTTAASNAGIASNVQITNVQVEPSSGSASLSIPIVVPPGRAGIQPNLAVVYNSSNRQLGNAGVGWNLDLGAVQISTRKGVPKYDGTDIFTMEQAGATQDLVADPNTAGLYHMEVEGSFARIQYFTTYWLVTDKKGIKYYYGNYASTTGNIQNDPASPTHIFRW
ncbi:MAG: hypothetical protein HQL13_02475, partial [Candidatus Omnitrophica bacterium]|nr:hypothetical protein [Candidatus Omnitrophota bacterium]